MRFSSDYPKKCVASALQSISASTASTNRTAATVIRYWPSSLTSIARSGFGGRKSVMTSGSFDIKLDLNDLRLTAPINKTINKQSTIVMDTYPMNKPTPSHHENLPRILINIHPIMNHRCSRCFVTALVRAAWDLTECIQDRSDENARVFPTNP